MRSACSLITLRKRSRASVSFLAAPCSVSTKPRKRGQRRAQLVAGVGHEIGAHAGEAILLRQVAEGDQQRRIDARSRAIERGQRCQQSPLHRHALVQLDLARLACGERLVDRRPAARDHGSSTRCVRRAGACRTGPRPGDWHAGSGPSRRAPRRARARHPPSCATGGRWRRRIGRDQPCCVLCRLSSAISAAHAVTMASPTSAAEKDRPPANHEEDRQAQGDPQAPRGAPTGGRGASFGVGRAAASAGSCRVVDLQSHINLRVRD